ncbi:sulfotransferase domain-containing protein [Limibaculum sp. FT325]|uniref:sulfotransferase domain-containing protein n=1 Tax=Thermohalobaculum sediminis TaxID=2939436 RepID=UPI0020C100A7|nr:sulfotransferase domain-containing protein [Limibaculum sediminis]MCL5776663.1 sulfotransferase domain-containing protein [Limibaculum sediminis]
MPTKSIVWLASYPKSGNTWTRIFLANYVFANDTPIPINEVHRLGIGDSVTVTYRKVAKGDFDPSDHQRTLALRGKVLRGIVANDADVNFVKTHCINAKAFGVELIPPHLTRGAVYIIRNPLDMVLSYARHFGKTPADAAAAIARDDNTTVGKSDSVKQYLGNWSAHVRSWTRTKAFPVLVVRYEDMLADPETAFTALLRHIGFRPDPAKVERSIRFSSFEEVSRQETAAPFIERSDNSERFFHTGKADQWKEALAPEIVERIRKDHHDVMAEFGYL